MVGVAACAATNVAVPPIASKRRPVTHPQRRSQSTTTFIRDISRVPESDATDVVAFPRAKQLRRNALFANCSGAGAICSAGNLRESLGAKAAGPLLALGSAPLDHWLGMERSARSS